jgi:serine/threonine-protein kinase
MAPEQLTDGLITPAVDIWALGVMLYECVTGQLPFGNFNDGRLPQLFDTAPRASTLAPMTPALERLIDTCLARDPSKRPASMEEIARALRGAVDATGERVTEDIGGVRPVVQTQPVAPAAHAHPVARMRRWPIVALAGALLAIAAGVLAMRRSGDQVARPPDAAPVVQMPAAMPARVEPPTPTPAGTQMETHSQVQTQTQAEPPRTKPKRHVTTGHKAKTKKTSQGETLD